LQYEVDSKLTSEKDTEDKDVDIKTRAHQQPSLEGDTPVTTALSAENIPTSNFSEKAEIVHLILLFTI
jgi:hypothetical protein